MRLRLRGLVWLLGGLTAVVLLCFYFAMLRWMVPASGQFSDSQLVLLPVEGCESKDPEAIGTATMANVRFKSRCGSITSHQRKGNESILVWQQMYLPDGGVYRPDYTSKTQPSLLMRAYAVFTVVSSTNRTPAITRNDDMPAAVPGEEMIQLPIGKTTFGQDVIKLRCTISEARGMTQCRGGVGISDQVYALLQIYPLQGHTLKTDYLQRAVDDALAITSANPNRE